MAVAAVESLLASLHSIVGGVMVSPDAAPAPYPTIVAMRGDHPIPVKASLAAAAKIAEVAPGRRGTDAAIVLISGGTSSLIGAPLRGLGEADYVQLHKLLLGSGLDIIKMNAVRKRFSRWGAGRLALALAPAAMHCLAMSDVIGDDLGAIGSGPCVPDDMTARELSRILQHAELLDRLPLSIREHLEGAVRGTHPETLKSAHPAFAHVTAAVIGSNRVACEGAAELARDRGYEVELSPAPLTGEAARAGELVARQLVSLRARTAQHARRCMIWGGETTVTVGAEADATSGGRCQEIGLAAARVLHDAGETAAGITLLAVGTDGRDGATDAAGACVDAGTWGAITEKGQDPTHALAVHASHPALELAGALIPRRNTGTNVADLVIGLVAPD